MTRNCDFRKHKNSKKWATYIYHGKNSQSLTPKETYRKLNTFPKSTEIRLPRNSLNCTNLGKRNKHTHIQDQSKSKQKTTNKKKEDKKEGKYPSRFNKALRNAIKERMAQIEEAPLVEIAKLVKEGPRLQITFPAAHLHPLVQHSKLKLKPHKQHTNLSLTKSTSATWNGMCHVVAGMGETRKMRVTNIREWRR